MVSKPTYALLALSLVALVMSSISVYFNYNLHESLRRDLQAVTQDLETTNQSIGSLRGQLGSEKLQQEVEKMRAELTTIRNETTMLSSGIVLQEALLKVAEDRINSINASLKEVATSTIQVSLEAVYERARASVVVVRARGSFGSALGTGFLYSSSNHVVTNFHVIQSASNVEVDFFDRTTRTAKVVGQDPFADLAVLEVMNPPSSARPLQLGNSSALRVGQQVVAIGNPLGLTGSLSTGVVSQIGRLIGPVQQIPLIVPVIQLDLTIAPGNSGGPLLDLQGRVMGVNNAGTGVGFNFAIPSNMVRRVADSIIQRGRYEHPFVGFRGEALTPESIRTLNIVNVDSSTRGIMIIEVVSGTPAQKAGLEAADRVSTKQGSGFRASDIIVSVDGRNVNSFEEWGIYVEENVSPGQTIRIGVLRSGNIVIVPLVPVTRV